eukprot:gnl/MRDRNA2_/MRDRNA2_39914_c0_seq1.p1 gnl/MRDRNA2_/MRDRNA2_39914_c0~~gnl/MRDRNA2_/MRDRNA2_39914_c0_seq1.p1  ORF type:complete len:245 (+),score=39.24 gnl/MRDRNA2_/MRDRNA2_39914_c0_seq1:77-811(+)
MGCGGSSSNPVYQVCHKAWPDGKINLAKLQTALTSSPEVVNESVAPYNWTALECAVLCKEPHLDAIKLLLKCGADPLGNEKKAFHDSPIGIAIQYEKLGALKMLLTGATLREWERLAAAIMVPPVGLVNEWGVAAKWVEVDGQAGEIVKQDQRASLKDFVAATRMDEKHFIKYESGVEDKGVHYERIKVLPQLPAAVKAEILESATANRCPEGILMQFRSLKEGTYGSIPQPPHVPRGGGWNGF